MIVFFLLFGICAAQYPAEEYGVPTSGRYQSPVKSQENYPIISNVPKNNFINSPVGLKRPVSDLPLPSRGFGYKTQGSKSLPGQNNQNTPQNDQFSKGLNPQYTPQTPGFQYIPSRPDQFSPNGQNPGFQIPRPDQFSPNGPNQGFQIPKTDQFSPNGPNPGSQIPSRPVQFSPVPNQGSQIPKTDQFSPNGQNPGSQIPSVQFSPNGPNLGSQIPKTDQFSPNGQNPGFQIPSRPDQFSPGPNQGSQIPKTDQFSPNGQNPGSQIPSVQFSPGPNQGSQIPKTDQFSPNGQNSQFPSRPDQFSPNGQNPQIPSRPDQFSPAAGSPKILPNKEGSKLLDSTVDAPERPSVQIPPNSRVSIQDDRLQYTHGFSDDSGTKVSEQGSLLSTNAGWEYVIVKKGSYSYTSPEGVPITVNYIADHNGFRLV